VQNVPLVSTQPSDSASSCVCNLMRRRPVDLTPLAYGARRPLLISPANRIRSAQRRRCIGCYKMGSIDSGLWCWDATTHAVSDDAPSQRRGKRGVLSFSLEVGVRQGSVSLPCKSLRGVSAPNTSSPLGSVRPEYAMFIIQFFHLFRALHIRGKNHRWLLVRRWKTFPMSLDICQARHLRAFSKKSFHLLRRVLHTVVGFPSIFIFRAAFPFHRILKLSHRFIPSSHLSRIENDLTHDDLFHLPL